MPLILKETFLEDCLFGMWEIRESLEELQAQVHLYPGEKERFVNFQSEARKIEFLSVRLLLKNLLGIGGPIVYSETRKPFIHQSDYRISISHSRTLTAIMVSKKQKVGLDLEFMSHNINKIRHRFVNPDEYITDNPARRTYHLYIHWCAKEALYKLCDKQDISFIKNVTIEPFEPLDYGIIFGRVDNRYWHDRFQLSYFSINNFIVVYCCKNL